MRKLALAGLALSASGLPLAALAQTTTNCQTYFPGQTTCTTSAPLQRQGPVDYSAFLRSQQNIAQRNEESGRALGEAIAQAQARKAAQQAAQQRASRVQTLAPLIADHQCDKAVATAMSWGDLDLAERVKSLCVPG